MRALVTGAGGQLGRTVARALADGFDVTAATRADLDITDESRVRAAAADARPGVIVNDHAGSRARDPGRVDSAPARIVIRDILQKLAFDTHAAVRMLTSAGAKEELAVAVVDIARQASAEHDRELATKADLANLKADLTWRLVAAMAAIGAILRFVG